jgi:tartrate-resistant acid phosphatase type 5
MDDTRVMVNTQILLLGVLAVAVAAIDSSSVNEMRSGAETLCFLSYGCWGGQGIASQTKVATLMGDLAQRHNVRFVIAAGDNFYKKGVKSVDDPRFRSTFEDVYNHPGLQTLPFLVALGNHDYRGNFWAQVNYTQRSTRWYLPHPYYERRFPEASLAVVVLDCPLLERCDANRGKPSWSERCWDQEKQHSWLDEVLSRAAADGIQWRVVVCHYPMYANGPHINHQWLIDLVEPAMKKHQAQLYINADNHYLQVSKHDGIYYFNSGGGAGLVPHSRLDKGYSVNPSNVYEAMQFGVGLHCIVQNSGDAGAPPRLVSTLVGSEGNNLYEFTALPAGSSPPVDASLQANGLAQAGPKETEAAAQRAEGKRAPVTDPLGMEPAGVAVAGSMRAAFMLLVAATGFLTVVMLRGRGRVPAHHHHHKPHRTSAD